jgi:hypothetical protein
LADRHRILLLIQKGAVFSVAAISALVVIAAYIFMRQERNK